MTHPGGWAPPPSNRDLTTIIAVDCVLWLASLLLVIVAVRSAGLHGVVAAAVSVPLCLVTAWLAHLAARLVSRQLAWARLRRKLDDELG